VIFPPGLARLLTSPDSTGSPAPANTIGIVLVAAFAARAEGVPTTRITSGFWRTNPMINAEMPSPSESSADPTESSVQGYSRTRLTLAGTPLSLGGSFSTWAGREPRKQGAEPFRRAAPQQRAARRGHQPARSAGSGGGPWRDGGAGAGQESTSRFAVAPPTPTAASAHAAPRTQAAPSASLGVRLRCCL
jgi:hypothetical protein